MPRLFPSYFGLSPSMVLLQSNVDVDARYDSGMTLLSYAALKGHEAIVKLLFSSKSDVNSADYYGVTLLSHAA